MSYENIITDEISSRLKNPIIEVLREIKIDKILKKSNFVKKDGAATSTILLHFIFMIVINKKISEFIKYSKESLTKDVYYRALKSSKYNWQKMLMLSTVAFINKLKSLQNINVVKVLILDDTNEDKKGKKIEGVCDNIWSNKDKKTIRGINLVSLNYNDGYTNLMLDFAIKFNDKMKVKLEDFKNQYYYTSDAYRRKKEGLETKFTIAINMVKRAVKAGIKADYLLVDSWYSKPVFVKNIKDLGLHIISRITNSPTAWQFTKRDNNKQKTLTGIYRILSKSVSLKFAKYNKIKYSYCSKILHHKTAGLVKVVFIKTHNKLIPILSTNTKLTDERIIEIYKKRWNIEQGYKELREHFAFGKEENRIYEALIARITISFLSYNITSYINRINHEPQTIGGLFKDLECELTNLAISMEIFIEILTKISSKIETTKNNAEVNMFLAQLISSLRVTVKNQLDFMCES
jgi:hypothetical protein